MMKKNKFKYLFPEKKESSKRDTTSMAKKVVFVLVFIFLALYIHYKPYVTTSHTINGVGEYLFFSYQFVLNQTLGIVHEGGHGVCYILPCPQFMMVINGTLFQWLFPLGIAFYYKKRDNRIAFLLGIFVLGISMDYTSWYMSTAHEGALVPADKSFLGVDGLHDFHYIFKTLGLLRYEGFISALTHVLAYAVMIGALLALFLEAFSTENKK